MASPTSFTSRGSKIYPGALQSIASSSVASSYKLLGTFANPARIFRIVNNSNQSVTLSWDATTDHSFIPANSFILIDGAANREVSEIFDVPKGTNFYVKGTAGTGDVYLEYYYALSS